MPSNIPSLLIRPYNPSTDRQSLESFVQSFSNSMLYYDPKYLNFLERAIDCIPEHIISLDGSTKTINGFMPLLSNISTFGKVYNSSPFWGSHGGVLSNEINTQNAIYEYAYQMSQKDGISLNIIQSLLFDNTQWISQKTSLNDYRIGQVTQISIARESEDLLAATFDGSTRRNIKKAIRSNFDVKTSMPDWDNFFDIHKNNMLAIGGRHKDQRFFKELQTSLKYDDDYIVYTAIKDNKEVAYLLLLFHKNYVEYFIPCAMDLYKEYQPLSLLIYAAMKDLAHKGFDYWNWGGTWPNQTGVYRYKKKWNAQEVKYNYYPCIFDKTLLDKHSNELSYHYPHFYLYPFT